MGSMKSHAFSHRSDSTSVSHSQAFTQTHSVASGLSIHDRRAGSVLFSIPSSSTMEGINVPGVNSQEDQDLVVRKRSEELASKVFNRLKSVGGFATHEKWCQIQCPY